MEKQVKRESLAIATLAMVQLTHLLDVVIMSPLSEYLIKDLSINTKQFGSLVSAYAISASITCLAGAVWADKFERKKLLTICYTGFCLATLACGCSQGFWPLLISRVIAGFFGGVLSGMVFAILGDLIPAERRGKATGTVMSSFGISSVIGLPLGLTLAEYVGWNYSFIFVALISVGVLVMIVKLLPTMNSHITENNTKSTIEFLIQIPKNTLQFVSVFFVSMLMFSGFVFIPFISPYLINNVGYVRKDLWMIYFFGGIVSFLTSRLMGILVDRIGNNKMVIVTTLFSIIPVLLLTNMPPLPIIWVLVITSFFFFGNGGRMVPAINLLNSTVEPKNRGKFMSINSFFQNLSLGAASFIGGLIISFHPEIQKIEHFSTAGVVSMASTFVSLIVLIWAIYKPSRTKASKIF